MSKSPALFLAFLSVLSFCACAGGGTGISLGYGRHGGGFTVFTDNLWYSPHQAGFSVPLSGRDEGVTPPPARAITPAPVATGSGAQSANEPQPVPLASNAGPTPTPSGEPPSPVRMGEAPAVLNPPDLEYRP